MNNVNVYNAFVPNVSVMLVICTCILTSVLVKVDNNVQPINRQWRMSNSDLIFIQKLFQRLFYCNILFEKVCISKENKIWLLCLARIYLNNCPIWPCFIRPFFRAFNDLLVLLYGQYRQPVCRTDQVLFPFFQYLYYF